MNIEKIIDEAFALYMPQDRYEITELYRFVIDHYNHRKDDQYNILEIGTKYGGTFYLWSMLNQSSGKNISIDLELGIHGGIDGREMDRRDLWFQERFDNVHFIQGDSHKEKTSDIFWRYLAIENQKFNYDAKLDFLFIDGDHTYEGVKQDFYDYVLFCKPNSIVAFHDINDSQKHRDRDVYVSEFWKELVDSGKYETIEFNSNLDWAGIGVIIV